MGLTDEELNKVTAKIGVSLLEQLWLELDDVTSSIIEDRDEVTSEALWKLKGQATGIAQAIVIFHQPFFQDVRAVSQESLLRYRAKKNGEHYQTIGIKERKYEMPSASGRSGSVAMPVASVDPVLSEIQKIPANHQKVIRDSDKPAEVMAKLFGCSEEAVRRIRGE